MLSFSNGDQMPALGLGTWKSKPGEVGAAVKHAVEIGYRHIDCAFIYGNEAEIGAALSELFAAGTVTREELWITSKLWNDAHAPEDVRPALERTLSDLGLSYLDLYLVHWPVALRKKGPRPLQAASFVSLEEIPLSETWSAMEAVASAGLARHVGVSNFSVSKLSGLMGAARPPEVNQIELHPYLCQPELVSWCLQNGVHVTAYSPLGSRDRVASMKAADEPVLLDDLAVAAVAARRGCTPAQVLLRWSIERGCSVIPKSVNPGRLAQNLAAAAVTLTAEDMAELAALDRGRRYVDGRFWTVPGGPYTLESLWG